MEGRNKKLLLSLLVLVLLVSIGKETYALFTNEVSSIVQSYGTGTLKLSYSNTSINLDNAYPMTDTDGMNQSDNTITITNIGTLAYKFNVILDPSSDSTISSDLIRVSMDGENPATLSSDGNIIIRDVILNPGSSRTFTIKLWINSNTSSSDILNKKFSASLTSTGIAVKNMEDSNGTVLIGNYTGPLYDYIKNRADTITTIDFSQTSDASSTNGIYMTTNTEGNVPVYYYRGAVDNNVLFANFCWKIIRTTETGGVKLIYNGVQKDVYETTIPIEESSYINVTNDTTYPYTFDSTTKTWVSTNKTHSATGTITFSVATAGDYVLSYTVSSEAGYDKALFYKNGTKLEEHSGTEEGTISLSGLTTTDIIKVEYTKDSGGSSGNDTVTFRVGKAVGEAIKSCNNMGDAATIGDSAFNSSRDNAKYVGYMYGSSIDDETYTDDSTIKKTIDTWYKTNMTSYTSQLEDTVFCNDRSYTTSGSTLNFGAYTRLYTNKTPTLKCQNMRDKFTVNTSNGNGKLTYPVGLITADEMVYAGGILFEPNNSFYLYTGQIFWALSPYTFDGSYAFGFVLGSDVGSAGKSVDSSRGVRPSVSLKQGIEVTGGSGTATDPFVVAKPSLYDYMKSNADTTTQIDFSKTSEQDNTNGIYTTTNTDSGKPVYYYRGNVDNRVIFANFCWRIVRTTETGGVKLIYDGVPSNGQCNNTGNNSTIGSSAFNTSKNDNAYVGYMYGTTGSSTYASTHANTNDSTIKGVIDTWYHDNMTSYTSQLEDTIWCNDRSIVTDLANSNGGYYSSYTTLGYGTNKTLYGPASRVGYKVSNPTPTLKCAQDNDKFTVNASNGNGALTYPVGLITADEMAYAGGKYSTSNSSFYLYTGKYYWALSPFVFHGGIAVEFALDSDGFLGGTIVVSSFGVRPSVSLQPGIGMTGGSGTSADPFVIG